MSFNLYIHSLTGPFTVDELLRAFGTFAELTTHGLDVQYDSQNSSAIIFEADGQGFFDSFVVEGPCGDDRLLFALHSLMTARSALLSFPDDEVVMHVATEAAARLATAAYPKHADHIRVIESPADLLDTD